MVWDNHRGSHIRSDKVTFRTPAWPSCFLVRSLYGYTISLVHHRKKSFAYLATLDRMHWIVPTPNYSDLYTDINSLVFLFDPLSVVPELGQTSL